MALPKLETPTYETVIPSTGRAIEYRPFLVKEEKILMIAQESNDPAQSLSALKKIIKSCTFDKVDPNELTTYDAEFLFLQLRIKSVGESVEFAINDEDTQEEIKLKVNLTDVEIHEPEVKPQRDIKLNDSIGITLKEVTLKDAVGMTNIDMKDITSLVGICIDTIYDEDKVYNARDVSKQELTSFVESMNHEQLNYIQEFITNQPTIKLDVPYRLQSGEQKVLKLRGLQDFFV
tara:strand:+ start:4184 stop:4882 length:699 start_codon:yes stop_codon:yes gene_type:complete